LTIATGQINVSFLLNIIGWAYGACVLKGEKYVWIHHHEKMNKLKAFW